MNSKPEVPFSRPLEVSQVRKARQVRLVADEDERPAVASLLGLVSLQTLDALINIMPWRRHGLRVQGELAATVGQICTVTGAPMQTRITESFDERLYPQDQEKNPRRIEAVIDIEATDDYETFTGDSVDLGALVVEFLALAIDPYPRRAGAVLAGDGRDADIPMTEAPAPNSPFAGLASHFSAGANKAPAKDTGSADRRPGEAEEAK